MAYLKNDRVCSIILVLVLALSAANAYARIQDPASPEDELLDSLAPALENVDVARNLNAAQALSMPLLAPKLGRLADIPVNSFPSSEALQHWEQGIAENEIGVLIAQRKRGKFRTDSQFLIDWLNQPSEMRIVITYHASDHEVSVDLGEQMKVLGYELRNYFQEAGRLTLEAQNPGRFYATAGQRLMLETSAARNSETRIEELALLNRPMFPESHSVFPREGKLARHYRRGEPDRFLKADLGSETEAATIPEIIVSGGIAFGEIARFAQSPKALIFRNDQRFLLQWSDGSTSELPSLNPLALKACFDFARRSLRIASDAIVDIDGRKRISISSAFRDTDAGLELYEMDKVPYQLVKGVRSRKSIIVDKSVVVREGRDELEFDTQYEIRFITRDRNAIALTQAALEYEYNSHRDQAMLSRVWGPEAHRVSQVDFDKLGSLTRRTALLASWTALFRALEGAGVNFSHGRYEFMKLDKRGRKTPARNRD